MEYTHTYRRCGTLPIAKSSWREEKRLLYLILLSEHTPAIEIGLKILGEVKEARWHTRTNDKLYGLQFHESGCLVWLFWERDGEYERQRKEEGEREREKSVCAI